MGVSEVVRRSMGTGQGVITESLVCSARIIGTCAVLYIFFLCRMLGAGDIKLMAVCVGVLGVRDGVFVIFCGLLTALARELWTVKIWRDGYWGFRGRKVKLAPYLFAGYCVWLLSGKLL